MTTTTLPEVKYAIGDTVYRPEVGAHKVEVTCPDCAGDGFWTATMSGDPEPQKISCPTCSRGWEGSTGKVSQWESNGSVKKLTIGSVRLDTNATRGDDPVSYMCEETGVGSGSIHDQRDLYPTFEGAEAELPARVQARIDMLQENEYQRWKSKRKDAATRESYWREKARAAKKELAQAEAYLSNGGG
jgi:hypothetical protein